MNVLLENLYIALPEMIILGTACLALLSELFLGKRWPSLTVVISCTGLIIAALFCGLYVGNYPVRAFSDHFIGDDVSFLMKIFICFTVLLSYVYSISYMKERQFPSGDYYVLGLFSTLGMMILVSSHSLLTVYLGLELFSLPVYAMTAIRRMDSDASEAAMKYFLMGSIASAMLLYGMSLIYGATGKLDLLNIANAIAANWGHDSGVISFGLVFIVAGVGFKLAAVPFHMWAPDVYQGAPSSVTLFISAAPKIAALGMAFRLLTLGLADVAIQWQQLLLILSLLSTGFGNLLAITQTNIKRLLAYSAISHMGYALFGLVALSPEGYAAALFYILIYSLMSAAAFGLVVLMSNRGMEIENIEDLKGLNRRNPWLAFMMLIVMFSMAGVPPTVGFFAKLLVLKALVDVHLTWVAVVGLAFAVLGAYYYIRIVKTMYFDDPATKEAVGVSGPTYWLFSINCLSLLYFGLFPGVLISACLNAFAS